MQQDCEAVRSAWMDAFDRETAPESKVAEHLAACAACRSFAAACETARHGLSAVPLPAPDPAADLALLAALRNGTPARREGWLQRLRRRVAFPPAGILPLMAAGAAAFVVTLAAASLLTALPDTGGAGPAANLAAREGSTSRVAADYEGRLEAWLERMAPGGFPPPVLAPRPASVPETRPGRRSPAPSPPLPPRRGRGFRRGES